MYFNLDADTGGVSGDERTWPCVKNCVCRNATSDCTTTWIKT